MPRQSRYVERRRNGMMRATRIDGQVLREMFTAATGWLEKSVSEIDALNVFPVPDGDTGTNMLLTMHSTIEEASRATDHKVSLVVQAMAQGALMGARGNSGVILSQFWRGLAKTLNKKETIGGSDLADALVQASEMAYQGLSNPVEGTILTVLREAASAARKKIAGGVGNVKSVLEAAVNAARESVANTPSLLPVLREAGVVDAGGQGLYTILEGALLYLKGETQLMQSQQSQMIAGNIPEADHKAVIVPEEEESFGYCTEFLLNGENLDPNEIRVKLAEKGNSLIVVGDTSTIRVHVHAMDPDSVLSYAGSLGTLQNVSVRDMDEQHEDFVAMQRERKPASDMAVVAVVNGDGLVHLFIELGVSAVVPGGQTMNPSTREILRSVESVAADKVIILPNNKNIVLTARQVESLTRKSIEVIPTETIPQGIAALIAYDPEDNFTTNAKLMAQAKETVKTIEITRASRATRLNGLAIKKKQVIGLLDGELLAAGDNASDVIHDLMNRIDLGRADVITIYYGDDAGLTEAEQVSAAICQQYPALEVEVISGGQPYYDYIISVE